MGRVDPAKPGTGGAVDRYPNEPGVVLLFPTLSAEPTSLPIKGREALQVYQMRTRSSGFTYHLSPG